MFKIPSLLRIRSCLFLGGRIRKCLPQNTQIVSMDFKTVEVSPDAQTRGITAKIQQMRHSRRLREPRAKPVLREMIVHRCRPLE